MHAKWIGSKINWRSLNYLTSCKTVGPHFNDNWKCNAACITLHNKYYISQNLKNIDDVKKSVEEWSPLQEEHSLCTSYVPDKDHVFTSQNHMHRICEAYAEQRSRLPSLRELRRQHRSLVRESLCGIMGPSKAWKGLRNPFSFSDAADIDRKI